MQDVPTFLLTQGVLGVACLVLGMVVAKLYTKNEKLQERIDTLQELRISEGRETLKEVTDIVQGNSQSNRILAEKIEVGKSIERNNR
jgi:hypothetical protein